MNHRVFLLNESKHLEPSSQTTFFKSFQDGKSYYWIDVESPDPAFLKEFLERLDLHSLVLEECLDPAGTSRVDLYLQSLFIKFSVQLAWDIPGQPFFSIICIPQALITIHERPSSTIENIAEEYSFAARFHNFSTAAIVYQIFDRLIDEDMAFLLETSRDIESLEEAMDQAVDPAQIDRILTLKQRIAPASQLFVRTNVTVLLRCKPSNPTSSIFRIYASIFVILWLILSTLFVRPAGRKHTFPSFVSTIRSRSRRKPARGSGCSLFFPLFLCRFL